MSNRPRTVLRNDFNKETFIFTGSDDPEVARCDARKRPALGAGRSIPTDSPSRAGRFTFSRMGNCPDRGGAMPLRPESS